MYPTTGYTGLLEPKQLECSKHKTNIIMRGKKRAVLIAKERIAYLLEIGHSETAHALQEMIDG